MNDRVERISRLMREIKRKVETVSSYSLSIKKFNFKLEALLTAFDAYTTYGALEMHEYKNIPTQSVVVEADSGHAECDETVETEQTEWRPRVSTEESLPEFIERMEFSLPDNKTFRSNAMRIVECLYRNREGMLLEDIIRNTGISRYKCIDILNTMLKTDPPMLSKKFDKGFVYSILLL